MKNPSLLLVATFLLLACTGQNRYAIQLDAASSDVDGYQLALYHQNADPSLGALDSALVEKGRCEINGTIDSADWYVLVLHDPQRAKTITQLVYLDGKLDVKLSGDRLQIQGSAVNDAWQGFMDEYEQLSASVVALNQQYMTDPSNAGLQQELAKAYQDFEAAFRKMALKSIKENIGNAAGVQMLKSSAAMLEDADIEGLLGEANDTFLSDPFVKDLADQLVKSKRVSIGQPYVDMVLFTPEGDTVSLSEYVGKGHYVLLDFWASWCGPCLRELPNVVNAYKKYHSKGFDVIGISLDESSQDWKAAITKHGLEWPQLSDLSGWKSVAANLYAVSSIPHTVLLDPEGVIVMKNLRGEGLEAALAERLR
ncbi:MAG: Thiol-disulfide oxidoreductase ResA [Bacteroidetes bacterium ADurb.Bin416]|nr:MAG: Thiol-disulfide oxidoreductase ResA [Bacteroidetes bacterium ADurb.Bin416]